MAWNPQGGGGGGPWGRGPSGGGGGGPTPPDIEEMIRRSQDKFKKVMPGGAGAGRGIALVIMAVAAIWLASGVYRVNPGEQGVELLFGEFVKSTGPGLHIWFPGPIGGVLKPNVERTNTINVGFRGGTDVGRGIGVRDVPQESLMLTGDQNIIDVDLVIQWRIKNAANFLFNIRDPEATIKIAAESAIREVIGQRALEKALTTERQSVDEQTKVLLQKILDDYKAGVFIAEIKQQKVDPPTEVIDAFNDVQRAKQDRERQQNEALAYSNDIIPKAKGEAERMIQEATAYKEKVIKEAEGDAKRFLSVYEAYAQSKDVTAKRLYLERMEDILSNAEKVIVDQGSGSGVIPYLPLPELRKQSVGVNR